MAAERTSTSYAWLAVATAIGHHPLKFAAAYLTGSVGLLSDALEGLVNLFAAILAFVVLSYAHDAPDREHNFGHEKAEYFLVRHRGALIFGRRPRSSGRRFPRFLAPPAARAAGGGTGDCGARSGRQRRLRLGDASRRARASLDHARRRMRATCSPTCGRRRA
jgi:hypothetical protein